MTLGFIKSSVLRGTRGAAQIGIQAISGLPSAPEKVQGALEDLKTLVDARPSVAAGDARYRRRFGDVSVLDYIPESEHAAILNKTSTYDCASAVNSALAAGAGDVFVPRGLYNISGRVSVPSGTNLVGAGGGKSAQGTVFKPTAAGAGISFGSLTAGGFGGASGGFRVDGGGVATQPFFVGRDVSRSFRNIDVNNAAAGGQGALIQQCQNCHFEDFNVEDNAGDGLVLDRGCGGLLFARCEANSNGGWNLKATETAAEGGSLYSVPTHVTFLHCVIERRVSTTLGHALFEAAQNIDFIEVVFSDSGATSASKIIQTTLLAPYNSTANVRFRDCHFFGLSAYTTCFTVANGTSIVVENPTFVGINTAFNIESGAKVEYHQGPHPVTSVTTMYAGAGAQDTAIRERVRAPIEITRTSTADQHLVGLVSGDAGQRFALKADRLNFGDGTGFTLDTVLRRDGAGRLATDGHFKAGTVSALPTPSATYRGFVVRVEGATNVGDAFYVCEKNPNGTFLWKRLNEPAFEAPDAFAYATLPRTSITLTTLTALVSGTLYLFAIDLPAGFTVSNIIFHNGSTAMATPSNQWFSLYDYALALLRVTADDAANAWSINTTKTLALSSAYTTTYPGRHYLGIVVVATTMPNLRGLSHDSTLMNLTPRLAGASTTGLTNPASAPTTAAAISAGITGYAFAGVS